MISHRSKSNSINVFTVCAIFRQRKIADTVKSLNNLLAAARATDYTPVQWSEKEEVQDLYSVYVSQVRGAHC